MNTMSHFVYLIKRLSGVQSSKSEMSPYYLKYGIVILRIQFDIPFLHDPQTFGLNKILRKCTLL